MTTDYQTLSADQLLVTLEQAGRTPDLDLIHVCLERREDLTPGLLEMLAEGGDDDWDPDDPRWFGEIHAGLLLVAFREPAALPIFAEVFRDEERKNLIEWLDPELPAYGPAAIQMLIDLVNDNSAYWYPRATAAGMLAQIAWHHPSERERILEALRALLPPLEEDGTLALPSDADSEEVWTWVASTLTDLRDTVSQPQIVALYERDLIDKGIMGGLEEYLAEFEPDASPSRITSREYDVLETYEWLHRQAAQEAEWQARAEEEAERRAREAERVRASQPTPPPSEPQSTAYTQPATVETFARTQPKVGRNDPCPCGSGRKYKHCCGKRR